MSPSVNKAPILLLCAALLGPLTARASKTEYQLGLGALATYNSQVIAPVGNGTSTTGGAPGFNLAATPWLQLRVDSGRITETLRISGLLGADVLVGTVAANQERAAPSYQGALLSNTRAELTARLTWDLHLNGSIGTINSYTQLQDPSTQQIVGVNLRAINFLTVSAGSNLVWEPSARLKITQPITFRTYIPYGNLELQNGSMVATTGALQSYNLDGGVGLDHQWARFSLGSELRVGWFLPQRGVGSAVNNQSVVTGQLLGRYTYDLSPRWRSEGHVGVFVATQADHFLEGSREESVTTGDPPNTMTTTNLVQATLVSPVGALQIGYVFPRVEAGLSLSYQHSATGEVFLGRMTISDAATLRAFLPLPRNFVLSASVGYRYARLTQNGGLSTLPSRDPTTKVLQNPAYHLGQADASLTWVPRPGLQLFLRGQLLIQRFDRDDAGDTTSMTTGAFVLQDFNRGLVSLGLAYVYPSL